MANLLEGKGSENESFDLKISAPPPKKKKLTTFDRKKKVLTAVTKRLLTTHYLQGCYYKVEI